MAEGRHRHPDGLRADRTATVELPRVPPTVVSTAPARGAHRSEVRATWSLHRSMDRKAWKRRARTHRRISTFQTNALILVGAFWIGSTLVGTGGVSDLEVLPAQPEGSWVQVRPASPQGAAGGAPQAAESVAETTVRPTPAKSARSPWPSLSGSPSGQRRVVTPDAKTSTEEEASPSPADTTPPASDPTPEPSPIPAPSTVRHCLRRHS